MWPQWTGGHNGQVVTMDKWPKDRWPKDRWPKDRWPKWTGSYNSDVA